MNLPDNDGSADPVTEPTPSPPQAQNSDSQSVPYNRFKEVNDQLRELKEWREQQEAAAKAARTAEMEQKAEFEQLAQEYKEQLAGLKPRVEIADKYEATLKTYLDKERDGIPDYLLPILDKLPVDEQLAYIAENRDKLRPAPKPVPNTNGANSGANKSLVSDEDLAAYKKRYRL